MSGMIQQFEKVAGPADERSPASINKRSRSSHLATRDCPRVTLRFSPDDYERLQEMADGAALATFIRAKVLSKKLPRKARRSVTSIQDKQAIAQILGLLGQSRIANNLNQLAYHANVGSLAMDDEVRIQIDEAYEHVLFLRKTLLKALGGGKP